MVNGEPIGIISGETTIPSVKVINGSFIEVVKVGI